MTTPAATPHKRRLATDRRVTTRRGLAGEARITETPDHQVRDQAEHAGLDERTQDLGVQDPVGQRVITAVAASEEEVRPDVGPDGVVVGRAVAYGRHVGAVRRRELRDHAVDHARRDECDHDSKTSPVAPA